MSHYTFCILLLITGLWPLAAHSQAFDADTTITLRFEAIGQEEGLPEQSVFEILEDHIGFIWLGTSRGLFKYDGYRFEAHPYIPEGPELAARQYGGMRVLVLAEGAYGDLWIGSGFDRIGKPSVSRFDRETEKIIPYLFEPADSTPLIHGGVSSIVADSQYVWISVFQPKSLIRLHPEMEYPDARSARDIPFEILGESAGILPGDWIVKLHKDRKGRLWLGGKKGLYLWEKHSDSFRYFESEALASIEDIENCFMGIKEGPDGKLWLDTYRCGGILSFDPEKEQFQSFPMDGTPEILADRQGRIWVGEWFGAEGLGWLDPQSRKFSRIDIQPDGLNFFPLLRAREIRQDRCGMVWIGSEDGPLLKYNPQRAAFNWLKAEPANPNSLSHDWVTAISQDAAGHYWVATLGGGLNKWDADKNLFTHYKAGPEDGADIGFNDILSLAVGRQGGIWYGFPFLSRFDPATKEVKAYRAGSGAINTVYSDSRGQVWVGRFRSLSKYQPETDDFKAYLVIHPLMPNYHQAVSGIFEDRQGNIWGGIMGGTGGFFRFEPQEEKFDFFDSAEATCFHESQAGYIWAGTLDGLVRVDPGNDSLKRYTIADGLPHSRVNSILEDDHGRLWMGTQNGLARLDPETETFRNYYQSDGLPANNFSKACHKNENGVLFFGGTFGIVYFHPDSIQENQVPPKLAFTAMEVLGAPLEIGEGSPLSKHISITKEVELRHWQNDLTIHYAALHYKNPAKNQYQVMLSNYNDEWQAAGARRQADYTNLDPGHYTFRVKASNSDGVWNDEGIALSITIFPPWWATWWAYLAYLIAGLTAVYLLYRFQLNRRLAILEAGRLKELDRFKTKLYTNITHEFRTPLTVIMGVAKEAIVQRNAQRLLHLVNQMLDLSRLESGKLKLHLIQADILPFLKYITESFQSLAGQKGIELTFHAEAEELAMDYDPERLQKVVSNLLSNAIKFTPEGGSITITVGSHHKPPAADYLLLRVQDSGRGIPADQLPHIYDRFYSLPSHTEFRTGSPEEGEFAGAGQQNAAQRWHSSSFGGGWEGPGAGTGIGLALAKELVELMKGKIEVASEVAKGTTFSVWLPIRKDPKTERQEPPAGHTDPMGAPDELPEEHTEKGAFPSVAGPERPTILIVEDNQDVTHYLTTCLQDRYNLSYAANGQEGIDLALAHMPDIIISDVMMPVKDGFELCRVLKEEDLTSHIPIILLTARADMDAKLEGLEYGADAYLAKPFQKKELEVRLRKLIELRQKLQARYNAPDFQPDPTTPKEDAFILKVKEHLHANLDDDTFGIEALSEALHLSRGHLHRKIKALTGRPTSHFIRQIRLQEAHRLLQEGTLNVSEVAYQVGYKDPSYFSKLFSAQYGKPPSEV